MALPDDQIGAQNPWWTRAGWEADDPHLRRLREQPSRLPSPVVASVDLTSPGIHTLRGPRQVGKSTDLKLLVPRALKEGRSSRQIIYLALDLLEGQAPRELVDTVTRAKVLSGAHTGALLLLDEVTSLERWQTGVKALWDSGAIDRDVVFCTGSSAYDLAFGAAERLPGRRGKGLDHAVLPQPFSAFARCLFPDIPQSPKLAAAGLLSPEGKDAMREISLQQRDLARAFEKYSLFGGLPASVAEAVSGQPEPSNAAKSILLDSLRKEIRRRQASEPAVQALLERVLRSLGSKTNWAAMAEDMGVPLGGSRAHRGERPDARTVRGYVEMLAAGYFVFILYYWKTSSDSNSMVKDKKIFFADPLLHTIARDYAPGLAANLPALVENAVGIALLRHYEPERQLIEGFLNPSELHVWQTARGGEIDFICGPRRSVDVVEVKYQPRIDRRLLSGMRRAFPKRPLIVATRGTMELKDTEALIPAPALCWALA